MFRLYFIIFITRWGDSIGLGGFAYHLGINVIDDYLGKLNIVSVTTN